MAKVPDPGAIYVALMSFAGAAGLVRRGDRLRGSSPAVAGHPELFRLDGVSDEEDQQIFRERFGPLARR